MENRIGHTKEVLYKTFLTLLIPFALGLSGCGTSGKNSSRGESAPAAAPAQTATMPQAWEILHCEFLIVEQGDTVWGLANKAREKYPELSNLSPNDVAGSMDIENTHIPDWDEIVPGDVLRFCDYKNE